MANFQQRAISSSRGQEDAIHGWSSWFQAGLVYWHLEHARRDEPFGLAPIWNFAVPATLGVQRVQIGCLMPSRDRVGRIWPLLAVKSIPLEAWHPSQLAIAGDWFTELGSALFQAVRELHSVDWLDQALRGVAPCPCRIAGALKFWTCLAITRCPAR